MKLKAKNSRASRSLATTLAIAFFTLSVTILIIVGSFAAYASISSYTHGISDLQEHAAQDASSTVSAFIEDKFVALETVIEFANPISATAEVRQTLMESLLGLHPAFQEFALLDIQGQQVAQISRLSPTLSPQLGLQLKNHALMQVQRYVSPVYIDEVTSEPLIVLAVPVKNVLGDVQGTLVAELNLKFMWELVDQLKVGETGYAYVVDNEGRLIAFED